MKSTLTVIAISLFFSCASQPFVANYLYGPIAVKRAEKQAKEFPSDAKKQLEYCKILTQFTYAFIHQEADFIRDRNLEKSRKLLNQARKNYQKATNAGLKAIENGQESVESLYWTAAALGLYISVSKNDFKAIGRLNEVFDLAYRALEKNPTWSDGVIYEMLCGLEISRTSIDSKAIEKAKEFYNEALRLSEGKRASVFVAKAEGICVFEQNREEFETLLKKALSAPPTKKPADRLADKISKKRAKWLLSRTDELFF